MIVVKKKKLKYLYRYSIHVLGDTRPIFDGIGTEKEMQNQVRRVVKLFPTLKVKQENE